MGLPPPLAGAALDSSIRPRCVGRYGALFIVQAPYLQAKSGPGEGCVEFSKKAGAEAEPRSWFAVG
jgi:hypothetical protein